MKQKFATLVLLCGSVFSVSAYADQYPTTANSDVQNVLCGSPHVVEALQLPKKDGLAQKVTITRVTANAIGDKGVLCNVYAVTKLKRLGVEAVQIHEGERLILAGIAGDGTIVAEEIDKGFADALLSSQVVQAIATNYKREGA